MKDILKNRLLLSTQYFTSKIEASGHSPLGQEPRHPRYIFKTKKASYRVIGGASFLLLRNFAPHSRHKSLSEYETRALINEYGRLHSWQFTQLSGIFCPLILIWSSQTCLCSTRFCIHHTNLCHGFRVEKRPYYKQWWGNPFFLRAFHPYGQNHNNA